MGSHFSTVQPDEPVFKHHPRTVGFHRTRKTTQITGCRSPSKAPPKKEEFWEKEANGKESPELVFTARK